MKYHYITIIKRVTLICLLLIGLQACKKEFMPNPVGEAIPAPNHSSFLSVLDQSPYTLFKAAWKRSNMDKLIGDSLPQAKLTFFVPTDLAMKEAGYTMERINSLPVGELNKILRYHILNGQTSRQQLVASPVSLIFNSLLRHPVFKQKTGDLMSPYRYQHFLMATEKGLSDNGQELNVGDEIPVSNGLIISVDKVLVPPAKQMIDVLREDGRFKLFVQAMEINSLIYDDYTVTNWDAARYAGYKYLTDYYAQTIGGYVSDPANRQLARFTLFAPTDEAFHQLGIYTADDIKALNDRSQPQLWAGPTASDSLLMNQKISTSAMLTDYDQDYIIPPGALVTVMASSANLVFYSSSLNNQTLYNYPLSGINDSRKYLDLEFGKNTAGQITVKQRGSSAEAASIVEENINTIQGPIHVVNRLIVPKGFSMWHK